MRVMWRVKVPDNFFLSDRKLFFNELFSICCIGITAFADKTSLFSMVQQGWNIVFRN